MGCIYKLTNKENGKVYIGLTTHQTPEARWKKGEGYSGQGSIGPAIDKYGWDGFIHEILEDNIPQSLLGEREAYWMNLYDARNPEKGYNIAPPGGGLKDQSPHERRLTKREIRRQRGMNMSKSASMIRELPSEVKKMPIEEIYKLFPEIKKQVNIELYSKYKKRG